MRIVLVFIFLITAQTSIAQSDTISQSDLVGTWVPDQVLKGVHYNTAIYKRAKIKVPGMIQFNQEGFFVKKPKGPRKRCGNDTRSYTPAPLITGEYQFNDDLNQLALFNSKDHSISYWKILWIHEDSFAFRVLKP